MAKKRCGVYINNMIINILKSPGALLFFFCVGLALFVGKYNTPTWTTEKISLDIETDEESRLYFLSQGERVYIRGQDLIEIEKATLTPEMLEKMSTQRIEPEVLQEYTYEIITIDGATETIYYLTTARKHWGIWSLLPALVALALCWITKEPITSLFSGIIVAAFLMGKYDITEAVLVPELSTPSAAGIIVLYLWLLGGLMKQ